MGRSISKPSISEKEVQDYLDLTFLTRSEVIHAYDRFRDLARKESPNEFDTKNPIISIEKAQNIPELRVNPFRERICKVFSSRNDGNFTFDDFLDMMSVFSENSPASVKIEYAFRIYDFDEDGYLNRLDIEEVITRLIGRRKNDMSDEDLKLIINKVFSEADLDGDSQLSYAEFEHAMNKSIDFAS